MTDEEMIRSCRSLLGKHITRIFDVEEEEGNTWCTIEFSNGEVHFAKIPYVMEWDSKKEEIIIGKRIEQIGRRVLADEKYQYVLLATTYVIWVPVEQKKP